MHDELISRATLAARLQVRPATIAKWTRLGWFPEPTQWISERVILYELAAVEAALAHRASRRVDRVAPQRATA
ncbi:MAG: hypothetical protein ACXWH7_03025 [Thermoanaerobaculia bacterium]